MSTLDLTSILTGIQVQVTYTDGTTTIGLSPAGGNVESGQIITVTGATPGLIFAAVIDDKIVPLPLSPDDTLEVPSPADLDCFNCFGDCPDCGTCADACNEDLDSAACKECMEACLECLGDCLDSEEFAEACHETTGKPPDETPMIIILANPRGGFEGSVPLGTFTILVANASGIYRLVDGKTNDTLYHSSRDGTTYDVKFPNPFGKTGFFRS